MNAVSGAENLGIGSLKKAALTPLNLLRKQAFPHIESKRLLLRKPTMNDAAAYHRILSCPAISQFSDLPHQPTRKRSTQFVRWMSKLETRKTGVGWIITLPNKTNTSPKVIGSIRINRIEKKARCGVLGYELHPTFWGQGYATEALSEVVHFAYADLNLNRLEAWSCEGNDASDRVLLSNGFQMEGVQREKILLRDHFHNIRLFARLARDTPD